MSWDQIAQDKAAAALARANALEGLVSVLKFLTHAQKADVQARTFSLDLTSALQSAIDSGEALYVPRGLYRLDGELVLPKTRPFVLRGERSLTEFRAGAVMGSIFRKPTGAEGSDWSPIFISGMRLNCNRFADRAIHVACSKKGALVELDVLNFLVEGIKGGDDTGSTTARFYENEIRHVLCDAGSGHATVVENMADYGINLTTNATDNTIVSCEAYYISEAGLYVMGGGNSSYRCHSYGSNALDTGPKYNIVVGAFGEHVAPYSDNVLLAGIKVQANSVNITGGMCYWAADNTPSVGGAVPVEIDALDRSGATISSVTVNGMLARNGNAANPFVRWLGAFRPSNLVVVGVGGTAFTPMAGDEDNGVRGNMQVRGRTGADAKVRVQSTGTSQRAKVTYDVNGVEYHETGTRGAAGHDWSHRFWDGSAWVEAATFWRASKQWDFKDRVMLGATDGRVGFYGTTPAVKPNVSGSTNGNAALTSLLTALAALGLINNTTS